MKTKLKLKEEALNNKIIILTETIERLVKEAYSRHEEEVLLNIAETDYELIYLAVEDAGFEVDLIQGEGVLPYMRIAL